MQWNPGATDRREHIRVPTGGGVALHGGGYDLDGRLVVIGAGELEVECDPGSALPWLAGAEVDLELRLDGGGGGWLQFRGRVTHVRAATHRLVIEIAAMPPEFVGVIEASLAHPAGRTDVVVTIPPRHRRH